MVTNGDTGSTDAAITGSSGIVGGNAAVTVTNYGTITGTFAFGEGILLQAGGSVINGRSGATSAEISGGGYGLYIKGGVGTVVNYATVQSGSNAAVRLVDGGTVTNAASGLISSTGAGGV